MNLNKIHINSFNINLNQKPILGNISKKNDINLQKYIKNNLNDINDNNISANNSNEHYKKNQMHNIINYNNNIKIQLNNNLIYKNLTELFKITNI